MVDRSRQEMDWQRTDGLEQLLVGKWLRELKDTESVTYTHNQRGVNMISVLLLK